jgi:hypothetical protein
MHLRQNLIFKKSQNPKDECSKCRNFTDKLPESDCTQAMRNRFAPESLLLVTREKNACFSMDVNALFDFFYIFL